ncbi:MAG TPA: hypothetical protein VJ816_03055 [Gemmatimonadales bacterium]|nr:hypothetical protein [Gemmatimonadales bacterium]
MALTQRRWLEIAVLGCLALAVIYWPGGVAEENPARVTQLARPHQSLQFRASLESDIGRGYVLLQQRDQILGSLARSGDGAPVEFRVPSTRPVPVERLKAVTDSVTQLLRPASPVVRTIVVPRPDSAYQLPTGGRVTLWGTWYIMPAATNGHVCLALPRQYELARLAQFLFNPDATPSGNVGSTLMVPLGPCAFYTAFGIPGAGIERWLRDQNYATASTAHWMEPPAPVRRLELEDLSQMSQTTGLWDVLRQASSGAYEMGSLNLQARACAHGRPSQCRAVLRSPFRNVRQSLSGSGITRQWWWGREDMGGSFLSELVRLEGRDAFARFWQSSLPVDSAFQQAFGEPLETWMSRWLLSNIERPRFGPVIRIGSLLFGLGLVVVAVIAAGVVSQRRQVG